MSGTNVTGITFTETYSISGSVSSAAGGSTISLSGASNAVANADSGGNFNFSGLLPGSYTITPTESGITFSPSSQSVSIAGQNVSAVEFSPTAGSHAISLGWTQSPTANVTYNVYRCTISSTACTNSQDMNFRKINYSPITTTNYLDTVVANGGTYYYGVTAVDGNQNESILSNVVSASVP